MTLSRPIKTTICSVGNIELTPLTGRQAVQRGYRLLDAFDDFREQD